MIKCRALADISIHGPLKNKANIAASDERHFMQLEGLRG